MKQTLFYTIHFSLLAAHCVCITLMIFYAFIFIFHNSDSLTGGSKWTVEQSVEQESCIICLGNEPEIWVTSCCAGLLHRACLEEWLRSREEEGDDKTCPR